MRTRHPAAGCPLPARLAGETVTDVADRLRLAEIVMRGLDQLAGTPRTLEIALLIPAVQSGLRKPTKPANTAEF